MNIKQILKGLSAEQLEQEKGLRFRLFKELKKRRRNELELGRLVTELHEKVIGDKRFKEYLEDLDIPRRTAYRWMRIFKILSSLPDAILRAADKRNLDLGAEKFEGVIEKIPVPENPSRAEANAWLDGVVAKQKESSGKLTHPRDPSALTLEQRLELTTQAYVKHCHAMESVTTAYWGEIPLEEQRLEVAQSVMGVAAAQLGIAEPFTVIPDPNPVETDRLVERLKARRAGETEVERVEEVTV